MIVVSDTSPLTALIQCQSEEILLGLFNEVVIPEAVQKELLRFHASIPNWLQVKSVIEDERVDAFSSVVDRGEAEGIELAIELKADRLLIDERKGQRLAAREGVPVIGLLGIVLLAKQTGLIPSARGLLAELEKTALNEAMG